jgi:hypothetical protein
MPETIKDILRCFGFTLIATTFILLLAFYLSSLLSDKLETNYPKHHKIKIQSYDTLTNDNAHFSIITVDSIQFLYVKYGNQIDLERLR